MPLQDIFHTFPLNRWKKVILFSGDQRDAAQQLVVQSVFQQAADLIGSGGGIEERLGNQSALQAGSSGMGVSMPLDWISLPTKVVWTGGSTSGCIE